MLSVLQLSTSSHVSFYINKSFFSPSLPLLLFLSCTPTQRLSEAHEDGRRKQGGGWSMTRERKSVALNTASTALYYFSFLFPSPTVCLRGFSSTFSFWEVILRAASNCCQNEPFCCHHLLFSGMEMLVNFLPFMCTFDTDNRLSLMQKQTVFKLKSILIKNICELFIT